MDNTIKIALITLFIPASIIFIYKVLYKLSYWETPRLNKSLFEMTNVNQISLVHNIFPGIKLNSVNKKQWESKHIVILGRVGKKNPHAKETNQVLHLSIPSKYKSVINSYYPGFDNVELEDTMMEEAIELLKSEYTKYYNLTKEIDYRSLLKIINKHRHQVAMNFVKRLKQSQICFNNEMYGLWDYKNESGLTIEFYKTDFFTFQVFQSIHSEISQNSRCQINNIKNKDLLKKFRVFLCSFGVSSFLITDSKKDSELLFAKRSKYNISSNIYKNRYHYSMNEAFSITDNNNKRTNERFMECLKRGLNEELGIPTDLPVRKVIFLDLFFSKELMQVGISSLCYFDNINSKDILNCYNGAKDGRLETDDLIFLPYKKKKLAPLIYYNSIQKVKHPKYMHSNNIDSLTDESRLGLFRLISRYPTIQKLKKTNTQHFV